MAEPPGKFPFLFGRAFIEARIFRSPPTIEAGFPFLFGGAFIEAGFLAYTGRGGEYFTSFPERLSLRDGDAAVCNLGEDDFPFLLGRAFIEAHPVPRQ